MERKFIDISRPAHGLNWVYTVTAKKFKFISANNVSFAVTENNYFLSSKDKKVHFQFMKCDQASYTHLYDIYMEVYPGIFAFTQIATEDSLSGILDKFAAIYKQEDYSNNPLINEWREGLTRVS